MLQFVSSFWQICRTEDKFNTLVAFLRQHKHEKQLVFFRYLKALLQKWTNRTTVTVKFSPSVSLFLTYFFISQHMCLRGVFRQSAGGLYQKRQHSLHPRQDEGQEEQDLLWVSGIKEVLPHGLLDCGRFSFLRLLKYCLTTDGFSCSVSYLAHNVYCPKKRGKSAQ